MVRTGLTIVALVAVALVANAQYPDAEEFGPGGGTVVGATTFSDVLTVTGVFTASSNSNVIARTTFSNGTDGAFSRGDWSLGQDDVYVWTNNNNGDSGSKDTGLRRVAAGVVAVSDGATAVGTLLIPGVQISATPSAPATCAVGFAGALQYVDDSDDAAPGIRCYCGTQSDNSTYDWLIADGVGSTACPHY